MKSVAFAVLLFESFARRYPLPFFQKFQPLRATLLLCGSTILRATFVFKDAALIWTALRLFPTCYQQRAGLLTPNRSGVMFEYVWANGLGKSRIKVKKTCQNALIFVGVIAWTHHNYNPCTVKFTLQPFSALPVSDSTSSGLPGKGIGPHWLRISRRAAPSPGRCRWANNPPPYYRRLDPAPGSQVMFNPVEVETCLKPQT